MCHTIKTTTLALLLLVLGVHARAAEATASLRKIIIRPVRGSDTIKRAQVCGTALVAGHHAASGAWPQQHRRDHQRSWALPERTGVGLHASGRQGLAPGRFRICARGSLSAIAKGPGSPAA